MKKYIKSAEALLDIFYETLPKAKPILSNTLRIHFGAAHQKTGKAKLCIGNFVNAGFSNPLSNHFRIHSRSCKPYEPEEFKALLEKIIV